MAQLPDSQPDAAPALRITDLYFEYGQGGGNGEIAAWKLAIPSLTVARGEQLLLTAGSGQGKSTLLSIIAGLMDPVRGRVEVAGTHIHSLHGARRDLFRGRHIGMVFQTFNLLMGFSAAENVMSALMFSAVKPHEHGPRAKTLLASLGIEHTDRLVERLSVGQQQRVAVARALACGPVLVLADEPTASLDPENSAIAMDLIQGACRASGAALLCVSHDAAMPARFERREQLQG